jgi:hypothetical protein
VLCTAVWTGCPLEVKTGRGAAFNTGGETVNKYCVIGMPK